MADFAKLTELKNKMACLPPLSKYEQEQLDADVKIDHVWSSNAIEGSTLTRHETEAILKKGLTIHGKSVTEVLDTLDLSEAYDYMMDLASQAQTLTQLDIRNLNRLSMAKSRPEDAGVYRSVPVRPAGAEVNPYADPWDIAVKMAELVDWANEAQDKLHPVDYAAQLHWRFVIIHPFIDGNGRTARLLMNLALTEHGYPVVNIQPNKESRLHYIEVLEACDRDGSAEKLTDLIADYAKEALQKKLKILELSAKNHTDSGYIISERKLEEWRKKRVQAKLSDQ